MPASVLWLLRSLVLAAVLALAGSATAQPEGASSGRLAPPPPSDNPFFFGGNIGVGFGDVTWVALSPTVGMHVSPRLQLGASLTFQYTSDGRYTPTFHAVDYGAGVFGRYLVFDRLFAQAGYEFLSYELPTFLGERRRGASSVLVGGGFAQPVSPGTALVVEALYNLTHDDDGPYARPLIFRAGINVGF